MVSRRKILSRSRDDLNLDQAYLQQQQEDEEDVWYQKDKLFKEHIQEVLDKWTQIDDEIWAKVIVFERNRRVAKAYARAPVLTINGSDDGFDGMRIGLSGFDNPMRDQKSEEARRHIGQGVKIKMDDAGNILIRRYSKGNVYVKSTASQPNEETSIGNDIMKLPSQALEMEKIVKLFDMKKFQSNVNRELRRAYPDRRRLETQCLSAVAFVKSENDILDCPMWVLIVNVVAMDMLKSKLPPVQRLVDIKNRPRIPIPDEDPYSVAGNGGGSGGSSGSSGFGNGNAIITSPSGAMINGGAIVAGGGNVAATREQLLLQSQQHAGRRSEKPPKLPPRDNMYPHDIPKPDYDDLEEEVRIKGFARGKSDKGKDNKKYDDPYYCGLRARVPNFVKSSKKLSSKEQKQMEKEMHAAAAVKKMSLAHLQHPNSMHSLHQMHSHQQLMAAHHQHQQQQMMWHARSYESGIGIYGQLLYAKNLSQSYGGGGSRVMANASTTDRMPRSQSCTGLADNGRGQHAPLVVVVDRDDDTRMINETDRPILTTTKHPTSSPPSPPPPHLAPLSATPFNHCSISSFIANQQQQLQPPHNDHHPHRHSMPPASSFAAAHHFDPCLNNHDHCDNDDDDDGDNKNDSPVLLTVNNRQRTITNQIPRPPPASPIPTTTDDEAVALVDGEDAKILTNNSVTTFPFGQLTTTIPLLSQQQQAPTPTTTATNHINSHHNSVSVIAQPHQPVVLTSLSGAQQQQPQSIPIVATQMGQAPPNSSFMQPLSLVMHHPQQHQPHPMYHQMRGPSHYHPLPFRGGVLGDGGTALAPQLATSPMLLSPVYVRHPGPGATTNLKTAAGMNNRKVSKGHLSERKVYEPLYVSGGGGQKKGRASSGKGEKVDQEEAKRAQKDQKKANKKGNKKGEHVASSEVELDEWNVEPIGMMVPDYEPRYSSALNLRERPHMAMHLQYQHHQQHVMPNYFDYFYYDRGFAPAIGPYGGGFMPGGGVAQPGKWASDHDIFGTLKRINKIEAEGQDDEQLGRRGEFRFNPAVFNGQMFRNVDMRYSTESPHTSSDEGPVKGDNDNEKQTKSTKPMRGDLMVKSLSEDSIDQFSLGADDSALVNFMRENNEIVNHDFETDEGAVATRTTNIRYVTKVYVPRNRQQKQLDEEEENRESKKPSQIPQRKGEKVSQGGKPKKSVSTESFFTDLDRIDIDEEQYEKERVRIEEHLEMLKEHSIKDYDSHDRKKLIRSNSHNSPAEGSVGLAAGGKPKSKLPISRRLSLTAKPDLEQSRLLLNDQKKKKEESSEKTAGDKKEGVIKEEGGKTKTPEGGSTTNL